jgi:hypothetical protein
LDRGRRVKKIEGPIIKVMEAEDKGGESDKAPSETPEKPTDGK